MSKVEINYSYFKYIGGNYYLKYGIVNLTEVKSNNTTDRYKTYIDENGDKWSTFDYLHGKVICDCPIECDYNVHIDQYNKENEK